MFTTMLFPILLSHTFRRARVDDHKGRPAGSNQRDRIVEHPAKFAAALNPLLLLATTRG